MAIIFCSKVINLVIVVSQGATRFQHYWLFSFCSMATFGDCSGSIFLDEDDKGVERSGMEGTWNDYYPSDVVLFCFKIHCSLMDWLKKGNILINQGYPALFPAQNYSNSDNDGIRGSISNNYPFSKKCCISPALLIIIYFFPMVTSSKCYGYIFGSKWLMSEYKQFESDHAWPAIHWKSIKERNWFIDKEASGQYKPLGYHDNKWHCMCYLFIVWFLNWVKRIIKERILHYFHDFNLSKTLSWHTQRWNNCYEKEILQGKNYFKNMVGILKIACWHFNKKLSFMCTCVEILW